MRRQRGAVGLMLLLLLVLGLVVLAATVTLTRLSGSKEDQAVTEQRLARVADAIEQFAGTSKRLPCPADPVLDTGVAVPDAATAACNWPQGTLPWRTLGLARDNGYDAWGRKLSYRVGTFTQADGVNMFHCDREDGAAGGTVGGLCKESSDPYQRNTTLAQFIAGKTLTLSDLGTNHTDVAYVVISHGATGLGGYTVSGARLDLPVGNERNNAQTGPYAIAPFSHPDVAATANAHFDDLLAYRGIDDLGKRIGLAARDWPEGATFNAATLAAATGSGAYRDNVGGNFSFMSNTYRATGGTGSFSFTTTGTNEGIGIAGGTNNFINDGEIVRVELALAASRTAVTLASFSRFFFSPFFREQAIFRFYDASNVQIGSAIKKQACADDGSLATLRVDPPEPGASFRYVEIEGEEITTWGFISSSFLLSEFAACGPTLVGCDTTLATTANRCLGPSIASATFSPASVTRPSSAALTFTLQNGTDNAQQNGLAFTETLPTGLTLADGVLTSDCGGAGVLTAPATATTGSGATAGATSIKVTGLTLLNNTATCTVSVNVTASAAGTFAHTATTLGTLANLTNAVTAESVLTVQ